MSDLLGIIDYERLKRRQREALEEAATLYDSAEGKPLVAVVKEVRDRLPASLTTNGNLPIAIAEDAVGLATEASLSGLKTTVDTYLPNLDIAISALRDALKPSRGTVMQDLTAYLLAAAGSVDVDKSGLDGWSALAVTVRVTYDASATAGVRVLWLYSPDGTNYDSEDDAVAQGNYVDPSFVAGATRQVTFIVPLFTPYVRIRVKNLDTTYAATVDMWTVPLR